MISRKTWRTYPLGNISDDIERKIFKNEVKVQHKEVE